eukprot:544120_1
MSANFFLFIIVLNHNIIETISKRDVNINPNGRMISWWVNIESDDTTNKNNIEVFSNYSHLVSRIYTSWDPGCPPNGDLSSWFTQKSKVESWNNMYQTLNKPLLPCAISVVNSTLMHDKIYPSAIQFAQQLVQIAAMYNFSGFTFDYEPEYPADKSPNAAQLYTNFLTTVEEILYANNLQLTVWVANWSPAFNNFGLLATSNVDELCDMETYGGNGGYTFQQVLNWMEGFVTSINKTRGDFAQAGVGLGPYQTKWWTPDYLNWIIGNMTQIGGYKLDIFRLSQSDNWPPDYWWPYLDQFMNGTL